VLAVDHPSRRRPRLLAFYQRYLDHQDGARFGAQVSRYYTQGTLQRLAGDESCLIRRGAVLALGLLGDYEANHTLGLALRDRDRTVRMLAEIAIRKVWIRDGSDEQRRQLNRIVRLNAAQCYDEAIQQASVLIEQAPWLAETWNQRAVAQFALGRYAEAVRDCHQTLEINPYHFAAASGMGHAYLQLGNFVSALECFRRALGLNRDLEAVRAQVERIARILKEQ
jgi:tetratricopeptide (TPR) repeat protein